MDITFPTVDRSSADGLTAVRSHCKKGSRCSKRL